MVIFSGCLSNKIIRPEPDTQENILSTEQRTKFSGICTGCGEYVDPRRLCKCARDSCTGDR